MQVGGESLADTIREQTDCSDLRNRPAHPGGVVSCEEAERMYSLCCRFLDVLIEG